MDWHQVLSKRNHIQKINKYLIYKLKIVKLLYIYFNIKFFILIHYNN